MQEEQNTTKQNNDGGPSIFFYSLDKSREITRILGGEVFVDYFSNPNYNEDQIENCWGQVYYLANSVLMCTKGWGKPFPLESDTAKMQ